jgi:threonyl-tRNA synthetase
MMFPPMVDENITFRLKPMNCPSHMTLYKEMGLHSPGTAAALFRVRYAHRYEKTANDRLTRGARLTQDDCHIFCTEEQIGSEFALALNLIQEVLQRYQFSDYQVRLSLRGEGGKYVRDDEKWAKAEKALREALEASGIDYFEASGEAAFYGPKADFLARDARRSGNRRRSRSILSNPPGSAYVHR